MQKEENKRVQEDNHTNRPEDLKTRDEIDEKIRIALIEQKNKELESQVFEYKERENRKGLNAFIGATQGVESRRIQREEIRLSDDPDTNAKITQNIEWYDPSSSTVLLRTGEALQLPEGKSLRDVYRECMEFVDNWETTAVMQRMRFQDAPNSFREGMIISMCKQANFTIDEIKEIFNPFSTYRTFLNKISKSLETDAVGVR